MGELSRNNDALRLSYCSFILFFFVFDECVFEKEVGLKGREKGNGFGKKKKREGKRGMRREKGEKEFGVFCFLVGYSPLCVWLGEKGLGRKRMGKKREGGGRGLVAIEACGWSPTCFVVVLVSHHTHPFPHHHLSFVLSCPSLVLFLFLPVCACV